MQCTEQKLSKSTSPSSLKSALHLILQMVAVKLAGAKELTAGPWISIEESEFWLPRSEVWRFRDGCCKRASNWWCDSCKNAWTGLTPWSWGSILSIEKVDWGLGGVFENMKMGDEETMREEWGLHRLLYWLTWWHEEQSINRVRLNSVQWKVMWPDFVSPTVTKFYLKVLSPPQLSLGSQ